MFKQAMLSHVLGILQQETTLQIETRQQCGPKEAGERRGEDSTQENMMMNAAGERFYTDAFTHRSFYAQKLLHTQGLLHREVFTQSGS